MAIPSVLLIESESGWVPTQILIDFGNSHKDWDVLCFLRIEAISASRQEGKGNETSRPLFPRIS